jgi:zinc transport system ATP-binding protein
MNAQTQEAPLIEARALRLAGPHGTILDGVDLVIHAREIVTVIGPNGAGKTTLVRALLGLQRLDSGKVKRRRRLRIGYVPQRLALDETLPLTVRRFLALAGRVPEQRLCAVLEEMRIEDLVDKPVQGISGGELQRVLLARALLRDPALLVLDEPAQGVDVIGQAELYRLIEEIRDRHGCGILLVSHDLHFVMAAADSVVCLNQHVCCTGHPETVSRHPEYLRLFGPLEQGLAVYTHHHDHVHDLHGNVVPLPHEGEHTHPHTHAHDHHQHG